jgi:hypothetical protein
VWTNPKPRRAGAVLWPFDVSQLLPKVTRISWSLKKDKIVKAQPGMTKKKFLYNRSRAGHEKNWGQQYQPPTFSEPIKTLP